MQIIFLLHFHYAWYRESSHSTSSHSTSSHSTDFCIARFFKNMNSSHKKVYPLYSTVFAVYFYIFLLYIYEINNSSHSTNFSQHGFLMLPKNSAMRGLPVPLFIFSSIFSLCINVNLLEFCVKLFQACPTSPPGPAQPLVLS